MTITEAFGGRRGAAGGSYAGDELQLASAMKRATAMGHERGLTVAAAREGGKGNPRRARGLKGGDETALPQRP